jgi:hypothetical protein
MSLNSALPSYSAIYAFGDSLSDAGNVSITTSAAGATKPASPPYYKEQYGPITGNVFSNGPTWVQDLSIALSASARSRPAWPAVRTSRMAAPKRGRRRRTRAIPRSWRFRCRADRGVPDGGAQAITERALYTVDRVKRCARHPGQPRPDRAAADHRRGRCRRQ